MKYALQNYNKETMARAKLVDAPVSTKVAIEICNFIRNKKLDVAQKLLESVMNMKQAVPYKRFNDDVGHKTGIGPGRYPYKASKYMLSLVNLAKANAIDNGLSGDLQITNLIANKGSEQWHHGRQRRRKMKKTHIEIAVTQIETKRPAKQKIVESKVKSDKAETVVEAETKTETKSNSKKHLRRRVND